MGQPQRPAEAQATGVERFRGAARVLELGGALTKDRGVGSKLRKPGKSLRLNLIRLVRWNAAGRWSGGPRLTSAVRQGWHTT